MEYEDRLGIVQEALSGHIEKVQGVWKNEIANRCVNASIYGRTNEDKETVVDDICSKTIGWLASEFPRIYCKSMDDSIRQEIKLAIRS